MKKIISLLLVMLMVFSQAACGNTDPVETDPQGEGENNVQTIQIGSQIHFCGSSTLAPVIASIGASFLEEYGTWDKVNPAFPAEEIDIAVTSGGSGDGPSSVVDGTADFGMLARAVKDGEKESLGEGYTEYMVASDALTISVNRNNPICAIMDELDTRPSARSSPVRSHTGTSWMLPWSTRKSSSASVTCPAALLRSLIRTL